MKLKQARKIVDNIVRGSQSYSGRQWNTAIARSSRRMSRGLRGAIRIEFHGMGAGETPTIVVWRRA